MGDELCYIIKEVGSPTGFQAINVPSYIAHITSKDDSSRQQRVSCRSASYIRILGIGAGASTTDGELAASFLAS